MLQTIATTHTRSDRVEFIIDDDATMRWLASFDSSRYERFFVIIDKNVNRLWGTLLLRRLRAHKKKIFVLEVEATEKAKSLAFYPRVIHFLEEHRCNLSDLALGVGGGVITDLVSFTCSTYMRALPFVAIPTTLIAQSDAATGGKTCLNSGTHKNLLGTFYYASQVYNNIHFLDTSTPYHLRQGYSEICKYGLLGSRELLSLLLRYMKEPSPTTLMKIFKLVIDVRLRVRKRSALASNLGHTFGHAMEKVSGFTMLHGDAISAGMVMSFYFSAEEGLMKPATVEKIVAVMKEIGLNLYIDTGLDVDELVETMMHDKKASSAHLNLVLLRDIARPFEENNSSFYRTDPARVRRF